MSVSFTLATIFEVALGVFFIWGFWNEEKLADLEDKLFEKMGIRRCRRSKAKITRFSNGTTPTRDRNCI